MEAFKIIGIKTRTTNENGQSSKDIPALWERFFKEGLLEQIPNKTSNDIYCIYTEYEGDHTAPYSTIIGCRVKDFNNIPEGMTTLTIKESKYEKFLAKGNIKQVVYETWLKIWNTELNRSYTADFEVYGKKAQDPENAEVDIYIALKENLNNSC